MIMKQNFIAHLWQEGDWFVAQCVEWAEAGLE